MEETPSSGDEGKEARSSSSTKGFLLLVLNQKAEIILTTASVPPKKASWSDDMPPIDPNKVNVIKRILRLCYFP